MLLLAISNANAVCGCTVLAYSGSSSSLNPDTEIEVVARTGSGTIRLDLRRWETAGNECEYEVIPRVDAAHVANVQSVDWTGPQTPWTSALPTTSNPLGSFLILSNPPPGTYPLDLTAFVGPASTSGIVQA